MKSGESHLRQGQMLNKTPTANGTERATGMSPIPMMQDLISLLTLAPLARSIVSPLGLYCGGFAPARETTSRLR